MKDFWEIERYSDTPTQRNGGLELNVRSPLESNLQIPFILSGIHDYGATFKFIRKTGQEEVLWKHHSDSKYYAFPEQAFLTHYGKEKPVLRQVADDDMEAVIDSLICHPQPHQHIEPPIGNPDIRVGGGIDNGFLFLFHLRYQLCPISEKREAEKRRLIGLFQQAIKSHQTVPANSLLVQP